MTPLHPGKSLDRRRVALVYALALAALWLAAPRQIVDLDALSRLSVEPTRGAVVGARPEPSGAVLMSRTKEMNNSSQV